MTTPKIKTVMYNGKPVGTYMVSGDREQELAASQAVLKAAGIDLTKGKAEQLTALGQARSFGVAAQLIHQTGFKEHPYNPSLMAPLIVNTAFCIEVFLKAIGKFKQLKLHGHDLGKLFDEITSDVQADIQKAYEARAAIYKLPLTSIRDELTAMNKAFEHWRYLYEGTETLTFEVGVSMAAIETLDTVATAMHKAQK